MSSRRLNDLSPSFRERVFEFLARLTEARVPVIIIDTLRTQIEQDEKVALGLSWTFHSKHQDGLAIDICPYDIYQLHGPDKLKWDETELVWQNIGIIGQSCGLKWGVVSSSGKRKDLGHFEYIKD